MAKQKNTKQPHLLVIGKVFKIVFGILYLVYSMKEINEKSKNQKFPKKILPEKITS